MKPDFKTITHYKGVLLDNYSKEEVIELFKQYAERAYDLETELNELKHKIRMDMFDQVRVKRTPFILRIFGYGRK